MQVSDHGQGGATWIQCEDALGPFSLWGSSGRVCVVTPSLQACSYWIRDPLDWQVFMSDNDVVLFDDPYAYFKAPPFSKFTVINQQEVRYGGGIRNHGLGHLSHTMVYRRCSDPTPALPAVAQDPHPACLQSHTPPTLPTCRGPTLPHFLSADAKPPHTSCPQWPNSHTANGGFIYIQNAQPNGPSVWIFLEATDRLLRHSADNWAWMQARGLKKQCKHMDQVGSGSTLSRLMPSQWACS